MTAMVIPAFRHLEHIERDKLELEECIRKLKRLEATVGYTAKSAREAQMPVEEARRRLRLLHERVALLRGDV